MFTNFTLFFSLYLLTPLLPLYLSDTWEASKDTIGWVLSGYTLVALIMRLFSGYLVDSYPRKTVLLVCLFVYFLFFGGYLMAGGLLWFTLVRTLHGAPFGASTVANSTMAIDVLPSSRRSEGIGYYGLSNNLASALAPTIGITLYQLTHNFDILFWLSFIIAGLGFFTTLSIKVKERAAAENRRPLSWDRFFLLKGWFLALNILFCGFCYGVLSNYLAIYGKEHLGITSGTGAYFMVLSAGLIMSRLQGARSLREGRLVPNAFEGMVLSTIGYIVFIACPNMVGYYGSALLIGLGNGHLWPAFQNMIIVIARKDERGTANSTILTSWDLGMGAGILIGGIVAEHFGYDTAFWMMAAAHVFGLLSFICITRRTFHRLAH